MSQLQRCPHCGTPMQVYRYGFSKRYAYALKALYLEGKPQKISHLDITKGQKDHFHFLEYWGLIERDGVESPYWKVTQKGYNFMKGHIKIQKYIWVYKAHQVEQPAEDDTENPYINIFETGVEIINKETAINNSTPYNPSV